MLLFSKSIFPQQHYRPRLEEADQRVIILLSLLLMLTINFGFTYVIQSYYQDTFYDMSLPGFWLILANTLLVFGIFLLSKQAVGWNWSQVGLAKPDTWWQPLLTFFLLVIGVLLLSIIIQPFVFQFTTRPDIDHLMVFQDNLPLLLFSLVYVWFHGAFLQELIFRAFFINSADILLGRNRWSTGAAVVLSSLAFGLIHAWQGLGGIILTFLLGLIFGTAYALNGRRIWPLILVHGLIDTSTLISLYYL